MPVKTTWSHLQIPSRSYSPTWTACCFGVLLHCCCLWLSFDAWGTTLLVSHPRAEVLQDIALLQKKGLLPADNLHIVGWVHRQDKESYQDSLDWIASNKRGPQVQLLPLDCTLPETLTGQGNCEQHFAPVVAKADGFLFFGGPDMPPHLYGQPTHLRTVIENPIRHRLELALLRYLLLPSAQDGPALAQRPHRPLLAICLGMQSLNVALGGSLYQDIPSMLYGMDWQEEAFQLPSTLWHNNWLAERDGAMYQPKGVLHPIRLLGQHPWLLPPPLQNKQQDLALLPQTLSVHHQAIHRLADPLYPLATSLDQKVIEAVGHHQFDHVLGVQFHPERHYLWQPSPPHSTHVGFFERLQQHESSLQFHQHLWQQFSQALQVQHVGSEHHVGQHSSP